MLGFLHEFGPTRKSDLIVLFADAMDSAYTSPRRAISGMAQAVNRMTAGDDPMMVAVENRRARSSLSSTNAMPRLNARTCLTPCWWKLMPHRPDDCSPPPCGEALG